MKNILLVIVLSVLLTGEVSMAENSTLYGIDVTTIEGQPTSLEAYRGKVLLIVNVASKCGFTKQYAPLQELYEKYREQGFEILGFPANNFMGQEPGSDEDIQSFCTLNYGVTFPMFSKLSVKGDDQHPLYQLLTNDKEFGGKITWNFNKFLIGRDGQLINRFGSRESPDSSDVIEAVEAALQ